MGASKELPLTLLPFRVWAHIWVCESHTQWVRFELDFLGRFLMVGNHKTVRCELEQNLNVSNVCAPSCSLDTHTQCILQSGLSFGGQLGNPTLFWNNKWKQKCSNTCISFLGLGDLYPRYSWIKQPLFGNMDRVQLKRRVGWTRKDFVKVSKLETGHDRMEVTSWEAYLPLKTDNPARQSDWVQIKTCDYQ